MDTDIPQQLVDLLAKLANYDLPSTTRTLLFPYYEYIGQYGKAEDTLFDLLETSPSDHALLTQGQAFYQRLQHKSLQDLAAGNLSPEEVEEGLSELQRLPG